MQILFTLNFNLQEDLKCLKTNDNEKRNFPADFSVYTENLFLLSIAMGYNANPLYNYSSYGIFQESDNSIDVLSIGDSNVYSSIFPLVWWEQQGFTGYTWGQPSQRIPETYEYLKNLQTPETIYRPN